MNVPTEQQLPVLIPLSSIYCSVCKYINIETKIKLLSIVKTYFRDLLNYKKCTSVNKWPLSKIKWNSWFNKCYDLVGCERCRSFSELHLNTSERKWTKWRNVLNVFDWTHYMIKIVPSLHQNLWTTCYEFQKITSVVLYINEETLHI